MSVEERQRQILRLLEKTKSIDIHSLKQMLGVSEPTVRNDLRFLESEGKLQRTHGGAVLIPNAKEIPYNQRAILKQNEKQRIGKAAATWIREGETVFLDAGSTIMALAEQLPDDFEFNAVTTALHIALEASKHRNVSVHLGSGMVHPSLQELIGPKAIQGIQEIRGQKVFLSVSGVDLEKGLTENHLLSAEVKKAMIESAEQVIVLADSSKMGKVFFASVLPLTKIDVLITDDGLSPNFHENLVEKGIQVVIT